MSGGDSAAFSVAADPCVMTGVSVKQGRGPSAGNSLSEFWTDRDEPVRLHETHLVSVTWEPGPRPVLTVRFGYVPGWVPAELTDRPVVKFTFGDVAVDRWSTIDEDDAVSTEVDFFEWDGHRRFTLGAGITAIDFSAGTLHIRAVAAT